MGAHRLKTGGDYITIRELSDRLCMSESKVWTMVNERTIPSEKFGRNVRVPRAYLDGLIERGEQRSAQALANQVDGLAS